MDLNDLVVPADLARALDEKMVGIREASDGQRIYNYTDAALYTPGAWDNPAVRQCRGLITDPEGRIVARPWAKFFNHGQAEAGKLDLDAPVEVTDKLDGSLGIIHLDQAGQPRVATRGSFESDQAIHATAWLRAHPDRLQHLDAWTPLVEIIYPGNRIVCDYGDRDELVLLGAVNIDDGSMVGPAVAALLVGWEGALTQTFPYPTLRHALAAAPRPGAEGLCVRYRDEPRIVKIKQDDYIRLHKIVTGLSERSVWEHMAAGGSLAALLAELPDELHQWTHGVWSELSTAVSAGIAGAVDAHNELLGQLPTGWTRKDYAQLATGRGHLAPLLFQLLDGRDPQAAILRRLKPAGDTRARAFTEATA